jgi:UDP-N-acetylmuramoyl-tripeptide--D-alanyl-D-alanine ligase
MLRLGDVIEALTGEPAVGGERVIADATVDSRQTIPGSLFVALPGERVDGHDYVAEAFQHGAVAALVQRDLSEQFPQLDLTTGKAPLHLGDFQDRSFCIRVPDCLQALQTVARFWRRKLDLRIIGITGSVGKSTTKEVVAQVVGQRYKTLKSPGNLNNEIGLPLSLLRLTEEHERAVLEMGFYVPGEIAFLCDLALPHVGVVTNVGIVHAERAGSQEAIARGKAELVEALPPAPTGVAILNFDDPLVRRMSSKTKARVFYYGLDPQADLWADGVEGLGLEGIRFRLHYRSEVLYLRVPLIGRHSVHTALRSAAVGISEGLTWQEIVSGLRSEHTQLRLVAVRAKNGALILDDTYNASPQSTLAALNLLEELDGRKVAVLGDMLELGQYETHGHQMVGARAAEVADELVTVGTRAKIIADTAARSGLSPQWITHLENSEAAIEFLESRLRPEDVVLVKGSRGVQMDLIVSALEARE